MGGKGSGNRMVAKNKAWKKSPVIGDNGLSVKPGEMADIVRGCVTTGMVWEPIDNKDPEQLNKRALEYFNYCIDNDLKPGNLGLYATWGLNKTDICRIQQREPSSPRCNAIKKSLEIMSSIREQLAASGKLNPVTAIFWQKNFDGLKDQQEVVIEPRKQIEAEQSPEDIQRMLADDIPIDVEVNEEKK